MKPKLIILVLLALNVALGIRLLHQNKNLKTFVIEYEQVREDKIFSDDAFAKAYDNFIRVNEASVTEFLHALGYTLSEETSGTEVMNRLYLIVPPFPCDACLERETENLNEFTTGPYNVVTVIAPDYRKRDLTIRLENRKNVKILPYETERIKGTGILPPDALVYFREVNGRPVNVFIPEKNHPEFSGNYFQYNFGTH